MIANYPKQDGMLSSLNVYVAVATLNAGITVFDIKTATQISTIEGQDTTIKILKGDETQPLELKGHEGPVLALDIHSKNTMLASFSGDGSVKVWDLQNEGKELYSVQELTISTANWEHLFSLNDDKVKGEYTYFQFSQNGLLLAASTSKGEISIFDFIARQSKKCEGPSSECQSITCIAWSTKNNEELAYCDASGQLGTVFANIEFTGDTDEDHMDFVSRNGPLSPCVGKNAPAVSNGFKLQTAFQPSCTPIHLEHRYLVWNGMSIVTSHADGANGAIDVEFHHASVHHSLHIPNYNNNNMASLSSTALVLAGKDSAKLVVIALAASGNKE
ncbi:hypothetical protein GQX74_010696 [Glossina fuscipes]|nr:hypothetical protein GQX74_010696 [Glossina fuscipes]